MARPWYGNSYVSRYFERYPQTAKDHDEREKPEGEDICDFQWFLQLSEFQYSSWSDLNFSDFCGY